MALRKHSKNHLWIIGRVCTAKSRELHNVGNDVVVRGGYAFLLTQDD